MKTNNHISSYSLRKIGLSIALVAFTFAGFATLGDGRLNREKPRKSILSARTPQAPGSFSLRSGYNFRGNNLISAEKRVVTLNTVFSYEQGNISYSLPVKRQVVLNGRVTFNPNSATR